MRTFSFALTESALITPPSFLVTTLLLKRTESGLGVFRTRIPKSKCFTCSLENRHLSRLTRSSSLFGKVKILVRYSLLVGILIHLKFAEIFLNLFYPSCNSVGLQTSSSPYSCSSGTLRELPEDACRSYQSESPPY